MSNLLIPFAIVNNKVKSIGEIFKQDDAYCLECGEKLILRNGDKNIKHLAHQGNSDCIYKNENEYKSRGGGESYEHKYAKEFIKDNLNFFRRYGDKVIIKQGEFKLGGYTDLNVESVDVEYRGLKKELCLSEDYIPDILLRCKDCLIALEIYNSNKKNQSQLRGNLIGKGLFVYEIDITKMESVNFKDIFRNMKLIHSDLKAEFDDAIKPIQSKIVECSDLKINCRKLENENRIKGEFIETLEREITEINKSYQRKQLKHRIDYLEKKVLKYEKKDIENRKCWSKCVKDWYSKKLNEIIDADILRCVSDSEKNELIRFKRFYNGKVGAYAGNGGDDKLKEIAEITKSYSKALKYLGMQNSTFRSLLKMEDDVGEQILKDLAGENILEIKYSIEDRE